MFTTGIIGLISTALGLLTGVLPKWLDRLEKADKYKYEIELAKLNIEAAKQGAEFAAIMAAVKADVEESKSVRQHDSSIAYGGIMEAVRASVRPVVTYFLLIMFCTVKIIILVEMQAQNAPIETMLNIAWDDFTMALFGAVMGFWFSNRGIEKMSNLFTISKE